MAGQQGEPSHGARCPPPRLPPPPRQPARGCAPPARPRRAAGGKRRADGEKEKLSPPPPSALLPARPSGKLPPPLRSPQPLARPPAGPPRSRPVLTAQRAAGQADAPSRRPGLAIAPAPRYLPPPRTPPAPHRGDSPARSLAAPQPSPQAGAALPGAGGTAAGASCPRRQGAGGRRGTGRGAGGGEARSVPAPLSHPSGARLAFAASPPCGRLRRDPPSPPRRLLAPPSWLSRGAGADS